MGRKATKAAGYNPTVMVPEEAKNRMLEWLERQDNPHQGRIVGKILMWFLDQPESVKRAVLGKVEREMAGDYADLLELMAREIRAKSPPGEKAVLEPEEIASQRPPLKERRPTTA